MFDDVAATLTATATATERALLSSNSCSLSNTHTLAIVSFSFYSISSCSCYSSELSAHHLVCPTAPHTTHTDVGLQPRSQFASSSSSSASFSLFSRHFVRSTLLSLCCALYSVSLAFFHSCFILLISLPFLFPLFGNRVCMYVCVCALFYPCACARCPCVCVVSPFCCCCCRRP